MLHLKFGGRKVLFFTSTYPSTLLATSRVTFTISSGYLIADDHIDRGGFSLEVFIILFTVACKFPN
jgi:hypothetical protein